MRKSEAIVTVCMCRKGLEERERERDEFEEWFYYAFLLLGWWVRLFAVFGWWCFLRVSAHCLKLE